MSTTRRKGNESAPNPHQSRRAPVPPAPTHPTHLQDPKRPPDRGCSKKEGWNPPEHTLPSQGARRRCPPGRPRAAQRGWRSPTEIENRLAPGLATCQAHIREQNVWFQVDALAKRRKRNSEESRLEGQLALPEAESGEAPASESLRSDSGIAHRRAGPGPASRSCWPAWAWCTAGKTLANSWQQARDEVRRPSPLPAHAAPRAHLDVAIVGPPVAVHALHRGRLPLHQVDSEQGLEPHRVVHMRVVGRQVHPANDEQAIHLCRGPHTAEGEAEAQHPHPQITTRTIPVFTLRSRRDPGAPSSAAGRARPRPPVCVNRTVVYATW